MLLMCCCAPVACAKRTLVVTGCFGAAVTGADVLVTLGGTTILSGNTGAGSSLTTPDLVSGTYSYTVTHPSGRMATATGTFTVTCPTSDANVSVVMTPATGYRCGCFNLNNGLAVSETLYATLTWSGGTASATLAYDSGTGQWVGTTSVSWSGCPGLGCASSSQTLTIRIPVAKIAQCGTSCEANVSGAINLFPCGLNMISSMTCTSLVAAVPALWVEATVTGVVFDGCSTVTADLVITE